MKIDDTLRFPYPILFTKSNIPFDILGVEDIEDYNNIIVKENFIMFKEVPKNDIYIFFINYFDRYNMLYKISTH